MPERERFEWEIHDVFADGDIEYTARCLQMGRTNLSKILNPDCENRHNPFWLTAGVLWSFDAKGTDQGDRLLGVITRHRRLWLPAGPAVASDPAKSTSRIGHELMEFIEKEAERVPDEILLKELEDIEEAVKVKVGEILQRRRLG